MKRTLVLAALALLAIPACAPVSEDALAEKAADSVETSEGEAALVVAATDAVDPRHDRRGGRPGRKTLSVSTNGSGTGPRGNSVERHGDYVITWNPTTQCATLDGSWAAEASTGASRSTTVSGLERCADQCPSAGGEIAHTGRRGVTVTLSFDGSDAASWTTSNGRSGTVDLSCGG